MSIHINSELWRSNAMVVYAMNAPTGNTCIGNMFTPPDAQPDGNAYR